MNHSQPAICHPQSHQNLAPWAMLERILTVYLECAIENPDLFKLVYERHIPGFVPSEESMIIARATLEAANREIQQFLTAAQIKTDLSIDQMRDLIIALIHGMTALHLSNNPDLPVGQGRFGSLIPLIVDMLKKAWRS